jgi:REase_AHJR-like
MNNTTESLEKKNIRSKAKELSEKGYKVLVEPSLSELPFDLGGYRPDLIARKNNEGIILDVKNSLKRWPISRFQDIAERIASHPGWRFVLIKLDDVNEKFLPSSQSDLPSWDDLNSRINKLNMLIQESFFEPALLFFSSILEAAMRKRAIQQNRPIWRFPEEKLLSHLFSDGEISILDVDLFEACLELRNKSAHGVKIAIEPELLKAAYRSIQALVKQWGDESSERLESA